MRAHSMRDCFTEDLAFGGRATVRAIEEVRRGRDRPASCSTRPFLPEGGGQPPDRALSEGAVVDVQELEGQIWHSVDIPVDAGSSRAELEREGLRVGARVHLRIDCSAASTTCSSTRGSTAVGGARAGLRHPYALVPPRNGVLPIDVSAQNPADLPLGESSQGRQVD